MRKQLTSYRKSWPANLLQVSNLTFDPGFKVDWGHHTKMAIYLLYICPWNCVSFPSSSQKFLHLTTSHGLFILLTTEVVPKIFPNPNVVAHLVVPAGWGSCLPRLAIFSDT